MDGVGGGQRRGPRTPPGAGPRPVRGVVGGGVALGMRDDWPIDPDDLGSAAGELRWLLWDAYEPVTGWQVHLAVWDPADGLAWAISASDQA